MSQPQPSTYRFFNRSSFPDSVHLLPGVDLSGVGLATEVTCSCAKDRFKITEVQYSIANLLEHFLE